MRTRRFLAAGAFAVLLAACGSSSGTDTVDAAAPATTAAATSDGADSAAPPASASLATVSGGQFDLGSLEGQDTVLWFWAPW